MLSIITITRNNTPRLLLRALSSVDEQTVRHRIEHIVVDGGDSELRLPAGSRATVVRCKPSGVYAALNEGIRHSTGEIIGMVHGNDRMPRPDVAERVLSYFDADPELDFVYGDLEYRDPETGVLKRSYSARRFHPQLLKRGWAPGHPTLFMRRKVIEQVGLYDEDFRVSGDFEMWLRLFDRDAGLKYLYINEILSEMSPGGISQRFINRLTVNITEKQRALRMHGLPAGYARLLLRVLYL